MVWLPLVKYIKKKPKEVDMTKPSSSGTIFLKPDEKAGTNPTITYTTPETGGGGSAGAIARTVVPPNVPPNVSRGGYGGGGTYNPDTGVYVNPQDQGFSYPTAPQGATITTTSKPSLSSQQLSYVRKEQGGYEDIIRKKKKRGTQGFSYPTAPQPPEFTGVVEVRDKFGKLQQRQFLQGGEIIAEEGQMTGKLPQERTGRVSKFLVGRNEQGGVIEIQEERQLSDILFESLGTETKTYNVLEPEPYVKKDFYNLFGSGEYVNKLNLKLETSNVRNPNALKGVGLFGLGTVSTIIGGAKTFINPKETIIGLYSGTKSIVTNPSQIIPSTKNIIKTSITEFKYNPAGIMGKATGDVLLYKGVGKVTGYLMKPVNIKISPKIELIGSKAISITIKKGSEVKNIAQFGVSTLTAPRVAYQVSNWKLLRNKVIGFGGTNVNQLKKLEFGKLDAFFTGKNILYSKPSLVASVTESFFVKGGKIIKPLRDTLPSNIVGVETTKFIGNRKYNYYSSLKGFTEQTEYNVNLNKGNLNPISKKAFENIEVLGKDKGIKVIQSFPKDAQFSLGEIQTSKLFKINSKGQFNLFKEGRTTNRGALIGVRTTLNEIKFDTREFGLKEVTTYGEKIGFADITLPKVKNVGGKGSISKIPRVEQKIFLKGLLGKYSPSKNLITLKRFSLKKQQNFFHEWGHYNIDNINSLEVIPKNVRKEMSNKGVYKYYKSAGYKNKEVPEEFLADYYGYKELKDVNPLNRLQTKFPKSTAFFERKIEKFPYSSENIKSNLIKKDIVSKDDFFKSIIKNKKSVNYLRSVDINPKKSFVIEGTSKDYYIELPTTKTTTNFIQGSGRKSSNSYLQSLYNPITKQKQIPLQIKSSIINIAKTQKGLSGVSPIKYTSPSTSQYSGLGLYERTEGGQFPNNIISITTTKNVLIPNNQFKTLSITKSSSKLEPRVISFTNTRMDLRTDTRLENRNMLKSITRTEQKPITRTISKTMQRVIQRQQQRTIQRQTERTIIPPLIINKISPIGSTKTFNPKFLSGKTTKGVGNTNFLVLMRRFGKFKPIGTTKTSQEAFNLGKFKTGTTLGATFKVEGSTQQPTNIFGYKTKKTKEGILFIEQPKFRLSTGSEKKEINYYRNLAKKIQSKRGRL